MLDVYEVARWRQAVARRAATWTVPAPPFEIHLRTEGTDADVIVTLAAKLDEDVCEVFQKVLEHLRESPASRVCVEHLVDLAPELHDHLALHGFALTEVSTAMTCSPGAAPALQDGILDIEELDADSDLHAVQANLWANERGFNDDAECPPLSDAAAFREGLVDARAFTARWHGHVVGSGMYTEPLQSVTEFTGISTISAYRLRGFATALVAHMLHAAARRGLSTAVLTTTDPIAVRAYERAGFRSVGHLAVHRR